MTPAPKNTRLESLDSIRGIAAVIVLLGHIVGSLVCQTQWTRLPLLNLFFDGASAVVMFFVLSGFVLSKTYLGNRPDEMARNINLPSFYLRRIIRIWIPWFIVFAASIVAQRWFFFQKTTIPPQTQWLQNFWHERPNFISVFRQCVFMQHDNLRQLLPQDWSLGVELKGSALIPFFIFLARRNVLYLAFAGGLLLLWLPTGHYYFGFVFGVMLAAYFDLGQQLMQRLSLQGKAALFFLGIALYQIRLAVTGTEPLGSLEDKVVWVFGGAGCVIIILASLASKRVQRVLSHAGVVFIGRISYSFYLVQFIVLLCLLPPFVSLLNHCGLNEPVLVLLIAAVFILMVNTLLATACYFCVELPAIALGRKLTSIYEKKGENTHSPPE